VDYQEVDLRITRSEVSGGSNSLGQVRRVYIGDAAKELTEGITVTQLNDPKIMNAPECLQIVTNRFNIFTNEGSDKRVIRFIKVRLEGQGWLPIGSTVSFSWVDENITIPYKRYLVFGYDSWDVRNDINVVILTDGIVSLKEAIGAARQAGRDDPLTGTYYDGTKESPVTGTPVYQQPVSNLRAGTYLWRIPEPLAFDFIKTSLPVGAGAWATINLAAIIPDGARSVHIRTQYKSGTSAAFFLFRRFGNTGNIQGAGGSVDNPGNDHEAFTEVGVSEDKKIDVYSSIAQADWTTWNMVVLGWDI